ncbi:MAG: HEAT repeat domain-containing protein [Pseudomonadota bacterium]
MRTRRVAMLLCASALFDPYTVSAQPPEPPELVCENLEQCLALLQKPFPCMPDCPGGDPLDYGFIHDQGGYFSLPAQFEKFGRPGVLALLELLKQPNLSVRARAGMILSEMSALTPADYPVVLQESRNGNDWIVPALARIGTSEALSELVSLLRKTPDLYTPHRSALKSLGNKAMPLLLEALSCKEDQNCDEDFVRAIGELASEPGIKSEKIRTRLIDIATNSAQSTDVRVGALRGLNRLKPDREGDRSRIRLLLNDPVAKVSRQAKATLIVWSDETAPMLEPSDCAIYYTQHDNAGNLVAKGCKTYAEFPPSNLKEARLRNIGALGPAGRMRTSYVLELLQDEDWDVRVEAARTFGRTGEYSAIPQLVAAITPRDWKLTYEAMISLKRLQAPEADRILENIAKTYWHPAVANAADEFLNGKLTPDQSRPFLLEDLSRNYCEARTDQSLLLPCSLKNEQDIDRFNQAHQDHTQLFVKNFKNTDSERGARHWSPSQDG